MQNFTLSRRDWLSRMGGGFGTLGLASVLAEAGLLDTDSSANAAESTPANSSSAATSPLAPRAPHFKAKAKRVIFLFMNGGPSHVDTFDPKPALQKYAGQQPEAADQELPAAVGNCSRRRSSSPSTARAAIDVSELFPHVAGVIDDICVIRSMHTDIPNHEPGLLMMNTRQHAADAAEPRARGSRTAWGRENQNLPATSCSAPASRWSGRSCGRNSFLPGIYQGCHINNSKLDPQTRHPARPQRVPAAAAAAAAARPAAAS